LISASFIDGYAFGLFTIQSFQAFILSFLKILFSFFIHLIKVWLFYEIFENHHFLKHIYNLAVIFYQREILMLEIFAFLILSQFYF